MFNPILTNLLKKTISDLDLIDTGALYRSINVSTEVFSNNIKIIVTCEDYIKYLIEPYDIVNVFFSQPGVEDEIGRLLVPWIEKNIEMILSNQMASPSLPKPTIDISFNA